MPESKRFLEEALACFRLATGAAEVSFARQIAGIGRSYLLMAHDAAQVVDAADVSRRERVAGDRQV